MAVVSLPECKLPCVFVSETLLFPSPSLSPQRAQPTLVMFVARNQSAGQKRVPAGSRARHSKRPYFHAASPCVFMRAEVKLAPLVDSLRATMCNSPAEVKALVARPVWYSSSLLPEP